MPEQEDKELRRRAIWSGTVTFGLVSIPVAILPAQRPQRVRLRMLSPEGIPLSRKYYCPAEDRPIEREEIIRGFEIEKGKFVTVTDKELDSLQPSKSREIDLRRFVPTKEIDPKFMDRAYFLVPVGDTIKPYRLLAETMEKCGQAGIATFVMRGKEYMVAILAESGFLMAETLRFADEIRTPESIGIPKEKTITPSRVDAMVAEIRSATAEQLDLRELEDDYTKRLLDLANQKQSEGKDLVRVPNVEPEAVQGPHDTDNVIDLMHILKRSMQQEAEETGESEGSMELEKKSGDSLERQSKSDLYNKAKQLHIPGRSGMNRQELIRAIRNTG